MRGILQILGRGEETELQMGDLLGSDGLLDQDLGSLRSGIIVDILDGAETAAVHGAALSTTGGWHDAG